MKILVINGPNINMLGIREPEIYGAQTYNDLVKYLTGVAEELEIEMQLFISNYEGEIVEKIQRAYEIFDGIVINAAAFSHTSIAILDALLAADIPTVEVHLSDVTKREGFRSVSYISLVAKKVICGRGFEGYKEAMEFLVKNF